jgi:membrane protein implicated in regulation of membrane protease activity
VGEILAVRAPRNADLKAGTPMLHNRAAKPAGNIATIEEDFPDGNGWVKVDRVVWPFESLHALENGDKVRVVAANGILLKVVKAGE